MTHLKIEQNNNQIEQVNSSIIQKLYDLDKAGLDLSSNLKGRLHAAIGYREIVNYLTQKYPELFITVDDYAIPFEDPKMLEYLNSIGVGSNGFVTEQQASQATIVANSANTEVTKFNEFKYFTNVTSARGGWTGGNSGYMRFSNWTALQEIDISNLTSIGHRSGIAYEDTFNQCSSLKKVKASDKLKQIGYSAFRFCAHLEEITGLDGVIELSSQAFIGCSMLTDESFENVQFKLPQSNPDSSCFKMCILLQNITLDSSNTYIPGNTFYQCSSLKNVYGLDNINEICSESFYQCSNLENLVGLSGEIIVHKNAFYGCSKLKSDNLENVQFYINKPVYDVTDHWNNIFMNCSELTNINISNKTLVVPRNCFSGCSKLESISGLQNIQQVNSDAFRNCTKLKVVDIGQNITSLTNNMFSNNPSMQAFIIRATTPPTIGDGTTAYNVSIMGNSTVNVYVPDEALSTYQNTIPYSGWGNQLKPLSQFDESQIQYDYLQQTTEP